MKYEFSVRAEHVEAWLAEGKPFDKLRANG